MIHFIKTNKILHLFTNTFLLLNFSLLRGKKNKIKGRLNALRFRTAINVKGRANTIIFKKGALTETVRIFIRGSGNTVIFDEFCCVNKTVIWILGDDNIMSIGSISRINNAEFGMQFDKNEIALGRDTQVGGFVQLGLKRSSTQKTKMYAFEGTKSRQKDGAGVSDGVIIRTSDSHPIFDGTAKRINHAADIFIGENAWVCPGALIMKGAGIGEGAILANRSILTKDYSSERGVLLAGSPAEIKKRDITWKLEL
jgi:acetyltransferase-like isoleucine patch superfamily enzyme